MGGYEWRGEGGDRRGRVGIGWRGKKIGGRGKEIGGRVGIGG